LLTIFKKCGKPKVAHNLGKAIVPFLLLMLLAFFASYSFILSYDLGIAYDLPVHNVSTGLDYPTIQTAINADETSNGNVIVVDEGTYYEHVYVTKSLTIIGKNTNTTIVDSGGSFRGFIVNVEKVKITGFTMQNARWAIHLNFSNEAHVYGNRIRKSDIGIHLEHANNNTILGNLIEDINLEGEGIFLGEAENNIIQRNLIVNAYYGISFVWSTKNIVKENTITDCSYAISLGLSNSNSFYHNNIIDNSINFQTIPSINSWDNGYPSGGNYWSEYNGTDVCSGAYQNETGSDGIGDTPYIIDEYNIDRYPLMKPYVPLLGDLNEDRKVDGKDIGIIAKAFGSYEGGPRWNPNADINGDGKVEGKDVITVAKNYGKKNQ